MTTIRITGVGRVVALTIGLAIATAGVAMARQQRPDRVSDQQLTDLVNRIDTHTDAFHASLDRAIDRRPIDGSPARDQIDRSVKDFEQAARLLHGRVNDRQAGPADAEDLLRRAAVLDSLMTRNKVDTPAQRDWQALRLDMNDLARAYGVTWTWNAAPARVDDRQVRQLLEQIAEKAGRFDSSLDGAFDRGRLDDRRGKDEIRQSLKDFNEATDRLRDRVEGRQSNTLDVEEVLRRGVSIDRFMQRYQLSARAEQNWVSLRGDLEGLARAYNVAWRWSNPGYAPVGPGAGFRQRLTGTYQLENNQGDDAERAADLATRAAPSDQRQRLYQRLLARLEGPDMIAIERHENSVTMASTRGRRVTFEADGTDRVERWSGDRTMNTRAALDGERLVVVTTGNRGSDFTVTFDPTDDGRSLKMTRTIDDEGLRQPATVRSSYRRVSDEARWDIDGSDPRGADDGTTPRTGEFGAADGTRFVALLDNALSTANAREGDLYSMTIRSPSQYEGAVIHGFVSTVNESGRLAGRSDLTLNLRSIRLRNGISYPFDGVIENVRTPDGETVRLDREGTVGTPDSHAGKTLERGAIGAALGAIIGAVAGGGKGAAIGAAIGAGGGAGTVLVEGRDRLELQRGTEVTITAGDPRNQRPVPGVR